MGINVEDYYTRYGPMVLRRCRSLMGDEDRALDAMQEVFVRLLGYRDRLEDRYPSSLLFRMATNVCLNMIRAEKRAGTAPGDEIMAVIAVDDAPDERIVLNDLLDRIFRGEPPSTREIAVMHYVDGMTYEEVAAEVGLSVSGVRKRLRKLKERAGSMEELLYE